MTINQQVDSPRFKFEKKPYNKGLVLSAIIMQNICYQVINKNCLYQVHDR